MALKYQATEETFLSYSYDGLINDLNEYLNNCGDKQFDLVSLQQIKDKPPLHCSYPYGATYLVVWRKL